MTLVNFNARTITPVEAERKAHTPQLHCAPLFSQMKWYIPVPLLLLLLLCPPSLHFLWFYFSLRTDSGLPAERISWFLILRLSTLLLEKRKRWARITRQHKAGTFHPSWSFWVDVYLSKLGENVMRCCGLCSRHNCITTEITCITSSKNPFFSPSFKVIHSLHGLVSFRPLSFIFNVHCFPPLYDSCRFTLIFLHAAD